MDKEEVRAEAKQIMDNFMSAMKDIEVDSSYNKERGVSSRPDKEGEFKLDEDFQNRFLENASKTQGNAVLANKGEWEK